MSNNAARRVKRPVGDEVADAVSSGQGEAAPRQGHGNQFCLKSMSAWIAPSDGRRPGHGYVEIRHTIQGDIDTEDGVGGKRSAASGARIHPMRTGTAE